MNETFTINRNGRVIEYIVIKVCNYKNNNYIIYHEKDDTEFLASKYIVKDNKLILDEIDEDEVWDHLDKELGECYE